MTITREEIVAGLKSGRRLHIDRRDSPAIPIVAKLQEEGLVDVEFRQIEDQSSDYVVTWRGDR